MSITGLNDQGLRHCLNFLSSIMKSSVIVLFGLVFSLYILSSFAQGNTCQPCICNCGGNSGSNGSGGIQNSGSGGIRKQPTGNSGLRKQTVRIQKPSVEMNAGIQKQPGQVNIQKRVLA